MEDKFEFPVTIYGNLEKYNEVLSKARLRIFYKYKNRNGTFITDEFAEKLLSTIAYAPVKGIYSATEGDFLDHGAARDLGRIYGIVPANPNITWENHLDEDGVERTYACTDVLIFTALYKEANNIVGKSQSMELYGPSLQYHKASINGSQCIVFDEGCFLGLQVLGDRTEPCFEGAAFYSLQSQIENIIYQLENHGGTKMPEVNFKLSDDAKFKAIWSLLNTEFNEEGNWTVTYGIAEVYDNYALCVNYESGEYERVYYTKNDSLNEVVITEHKKCYIVDVTENEMNTLQALRTLNGETYEKVSDVLANAEENYNKVAELSAKNEELNTEVATLHTENENLIAAADNAKAEYENSLAEKDAELAAKEDNLNSLNTEVEALRQYQHDAEIQKKENVVSEYIGKLSDDTLATYKQKYDEYTTEELDMHLAYELKKSNSAIFSKETQTSYLPKDIEISGIEAVLSKYKK